MLSRRELLLLLVLFAASLPAVTARLYSSDEVEYFSYLRSLWFDHDVSFENEYQYFFDHTSRSRRISTDVSRARNGDRSPINYGTIGCAMLWAPFYARWRRHRRARCARWDAPVDANGYSRPYVSAVVYGSAFYGFAADRARRIAARARLIGHKQFSSGLAVWFGTPLLFYMYVAPPFSHACSAFAVAPSSQSG